MKKPVMKLCLVIICLLLACTITGRSYAESANRLAVEAKKAWDQAQEETDPRKRLLTLKSILERFDRIVEEYPDSDRAVELLGDEAVAGLKRSQVEAAVTSLGTSPELCFADPSPDCLLARARNVASYARKNPLLAEVALSQISLGLVEPAEGTVRAARQSPQSSSVEGLSLLAIAYDRLGDAESSRSIMEEAAERARRLWHGRGRLVPLALVMFRNEQLGDYGSAASAFRQIVEGAENMDQTRWLIDGVGTVSLACIDENAFLETLDQYAHLFLRSEITLSHKVYDCLAPYFDHLNAPQAFLKVLSATKLARLLAPDGASAPVIASLREAEERLSAVTGPEYVAWGLVALSEALSLHGEIGKARQLLDRAFEIISGIEDSERISVMLYATRVGIAQSGDAGIKRHVGSIFDDALALSSAKDMVRILVRLAEIAHAGGLDDAAKRLLDKYLESKHAKYDFQMTTRAGQLLVELGDTAATRSPLESAFRSNSDWLREFVASNGVVENPLTAKDGVRQLAALSEPLSSLVATPMPANPVSQIPPRLGAVVRASPRWALAVFLPVFRFQSQSGDVAAALDTYRYFLKFFGPDPSVRMDEPTHEERLLVEVRALSLMAHALPASDELPNSSTAGD